MGLLDALKQYVSDSMPGGLLNPEWNKTNGQRLAEELNRGLLESTGINARDKRRAWERNKLDAVSGSSDTKASLNQQAYDSAMAMAGMAPMGLTVWHGSPHKFDKFDMSKIGTGEGAQAYGHGLYMAETPAVAKDYAEKLSSAGLARTKLSQSGGNIDAAIEGARNSIKHYQDIIAKGGGGDPRRANGMLSLAEKNLSDLLAMKNGTLDEAGNLYKVDIPDEAVARMLDWDKPLSQQAPEVQKVLRNMLTKARKSFQGIDPNGDPIAGQVHHLYAQHRGGNANAIAEELAQSGIPGIRYLDGGSRAGGQGTSNYVLFSDQLPRILEVNGKPTGQTPWAAGEWNGLLGQ